MQKYPEAPDRKLKKRMPGKKDRLCAKEKFEYTSTVHLRLKGPSFTRLLASNTRLIRFSSLNSCLLLASRHAEISSIKIISHRKRLFPWVSRRISSPKEWLLNTEIKLKLKRYLLSSFPIFPSFRNSFAPVYRKETKNEDGGKKKTESDI